MRKTLSWITTLLVIVVISVCGSISAFATDGPAVFEITLAATAPTVGDLEGGDTTYFPCASVAWFEDDGDIVTYDKRWGGGPDGTVIDITDDLATVYAKYSAAMAADYTDISAVDDITAGGTFFSTNNGGVTFDMVGAIAAVFGTVDVPSWTFVTDGTGDSEVELPDGSINTDEILDDTITNDDMGDDSVDSDEIADGAVDNVHLAIDIITKDEMADDDHGEISWVGGAASVDAVADATTLHANTTNGLVVETGGASALLSKITEEVTIGVAAGNTPPVVSSSNLAPAGTIVGMAWKVIDAPGGGAATLDIGITGGDLDGLTDGASCDVLNEEGSMNANHAADFAPLTLFNTAATTFTLTTDADVTVDEMIVEITVFYYAFTAPPDGA